MLTTLFYVVCMLKTRMFIVEKSERLFRDVYGNKMSFSVFEGVQHFPNHFFTKECMLRKNDGGSILINSSMTVVMDISSNAWHALIWVYCLCAFLLVPFTVAGPRNLTQAWGSSSTRHSLEVLNSPCFIYPLSFAAMNSWTARLWSTGPIHFKMAWYAWTNTAREGPKEWSPVRNHPNLVRFLSPRQAAKSLSRNQHVWKSLISCHSKYGYSLPCLYQATVRDQLTMHFHESIICLSAPHVHPNLNACPKKLSPGVKPFSESAQACQNRTNTPKRDTKWVPLLLECILHYPSSFPSTFFEIFEKKIITHVYLW